MEDLLNSRARRAINAGLGWEDIAVRLELPRDYAHRMVLRGGWSGMMTPSQVRVLDFIESEARAGRGFPSNEAVAAHMGWKNSASAVHVFQALCGWGCLRRRWIKMESGGSRLAFELAKEQQEARA